MGEDMPESKERRFVFFADQRGTERRSRNQMLVLVVVLVLE